jgi:hypothetical protein
MPRQSLPHIGQPEALARENPERGYRKIHGELAALDESPLGQVPPRLA